MRKDRVFGSEQVMYVDYSALLYGKLLIIFSSDRATGLAVHLPLPSPSYATQRANAKERECQSGRSKDVMSRVCPDMEKSKSRNE
jgi:hypothetical protein